MVEVIIEKLYSLVGMNQEEKDVLVETIRHRYVHMPNDHPHYKILNKMLAGLK